MNNRCTASIVDERGTRVTFLLARHDHTDSPADSHYPSLTRHPSVWPGNGYWGDIALVGNVSRGNMSPVYCSLKTKVFAKMKLPIHLAGPPSG